MIPNVGCFRILSGQTFSTLLNQYMKHSQQMVDLTKCITENTSTRYNSLFRMVYFINVAGPLSYRRPCYCPKRPTFGIRWYLTRVETHLYSVCINFGWTPFALICFLGSEKEGTTTVSYQVFRQYIKQLRGFFKLFLVWMVRSGDILLTISFSFMHTLFSFACPLHLNQEKHKKLKRTRTDGARKFQK